jgi:predicted component of viral defense system (DUF524 family)
MMDIKDGTLNIPLDHIEPGLHIVFKDADERFFISNDYLTYNEAQFQFSEGVFYSYKLIQSRETGSQQLWKMDLSHGLNGVFKPYSKLDTNEGSFVPNTFVGSLRIPLIKDDKSAHFYIEVQSSKIDYSDKESVRNKLGQFRSEYQLMLEGIVEHCMDLIIQYNIPIEQTYVSGTEQISEKELYQRFLFVRSLFKNQEFEEAVQKIISNPATKWEVEMEQKDVRSVRRFTSKNIRELASGPNRMKLSKSIGKLNSIPVKISSNRKVESIDTPENRFIKHIISSFQAFCEGILPKLKNAKLYRESEEVQSFSQRLDYLMNQSFFNGINRPNTLKINSPILQRRSGYRELLRAWLRFNLTAKLRWKFDNDQDDLFTGGKKDIASLYEYWVFFVLFKTFTEKYGDHSKKSPKDWIEGLIVSDSKGLSLKLQEGKTRAFEFNYTQGKRPLTIKFYYNRSFLGGKIYSEDKRAGSYSKSFRPDYTLSIWPSELKDTEAEEKESIVHIHFDAKYKVEYSFIQDEKIELTTDIDVNGIDKFSEQEKMQIIEENIASASVSIRDREERKGIFKNIDLYKMHAYKDAIRRSGGAYILYPGHDDKNKEFKGFHEIIPGVGAFALRPKNENHASKNISDFISNVIENLEDVLSQREQIAKKSRVIYEQKPFEIIDPKLDQLCRELNADSNPSETNVLVGYYKNTQHLKWIEKSLLYNIRFGEKYPINADMLSSKYLVMYGNSKFEHTYIYKINSLKSKIMTREDLLKLSPNRYPTTPTQNFYFVFHLEEKIELDAFYFDKESPIIKEKIVKNKLTFMPFNLSLLELAKIRIA